MLPSASATCTSSKRRWVRCRSARRRSSFAAVLEQTNRREHAGDLAVFGPPQRPTVGLSAQLPAASPASSRPPLPPLPSFSHLPCCLSRQPPPPLPNTRMPTLPRSPQSGRPPYPQRLPRCPCLQPHLPFPPSSPLGQAGQVRGQRRGGGCFVRQPGRPLHRRIPGGRRPPHRAAPPVQALHTAGGCWWGPPRQRCSSADARPARAESSVEEAALAGRPRSTRVLPLTHTHTHAHHPHPPAPPSCPRSSRRGATMRAGYWEPTTASSPPMPWRCWCSTSSTSTALSCTHPWT
jgi:hypothetical protein